MRGFCGCFRMFMNGVPIVIGEGYATVIRVMNSGSTNDCRGCSTDIVFPFRDVNICIICFIFSGVILSGTVSFPCLMCLIDMCLLGRM